VGIHAQTVLPSEARHDLTHAYSRPTKDVAMRLSLDGDLVATLLSRFRLDRGIRAVKILGVF